MAIARPVDQEIPNMGGLLAQQLPRSSHKNCEKRKPKYASRVPKSTLSLDHYARSEHLLCSQLRSYLLPYKVKERNLFHPDS